MSDTGGGRGRPEPDIDRENGMAAGCQVGRVSPPVCQIGSRSGRGPYSSAEGPGEGGVPGSEVDVLTRVAASGSIAGDAIVIPVEVKLSSNAEARTGLRDQLVGRYMSELGTSHGVFVVVWMDAPKVAANHRPIWPNRSAAEAESR